ncbi:class I SAM-dependent methyltransferase [Tateyamaria sp. SN6-1]|uniref:class I SAM-dependent methyltransferase n=1 Tax=Tateyamaria sp. SN6-1 TaxID=3092148 RepID=UPI0039F455B1
MSLNTHAIDGYAAQAPALIAQYDAVPSDRIYAGVRDLLPGAPARVLDVGAGNGRDAEWCAAQGHTVTAVDPVAAFVSETMRRVPAATILRDSLPALKSVRGSFGLILVNGVWQHIDPTDRRTALTRLAGLLADGGRIVLSLRHGTGHPDRPTAPIDTDATVTNGTALGLTLVRRVNTGSLQAANVVRGVTWTWLVFQKGERA